MLPEDPILLPEILNEIVLVAVHPAGERKNEELQRRGHPPRLLGRLGQHRPDFGRFFAPSGIDECASWHCPAGRVNLTIPK
jgi:hypothetical protein